MIIGNHKSLITKYVGYTLHSAHAQRNNIIGTHCSVSSSLRILDVDGCALLDDLAFPAILSSAQYKKATQRNSYIGSTTRVTQCFLLYQKFHCELH